MKRVQAVVFGHLGLCLILFCCIASPNIVFAGEKQYPVEGIVTTLGTSQETTGGSNTPVTNIMHRTYTVKTSTRILVLECPYWMNGFHIHSPSECGGSKKIELGDTIHFRVQKRHAYVQTAEGKEQKLAVLSEGINEAGAPEASKRP
jgi:Cu/Zn superoxide dismutase